MALLTAWIEGEPVAKARPRVTMIGGRARAYTPKKSADWEKHIRASLQCRPTDVPVALKIQFYMPIPKSYSKAKRQQAIDGLMLPSKKPDIDNLIKAVMDALNGYAWLDDNQVVQVSAVKRYSETAGVWIEVLDGSP